MKSGKQSKIKAINGQEIDTNIVVIAALKCIYQEIMKGLKNDAKKHGKTTNINGINVIQWIVAVPAIWNDTDKDKMLKWMNKAGLTDNNIKDHCIFKSVTECGSISLKHEIITKLNTDNDDSKNRDNNSNISGKQCILINSGRNGTNITCHEFMNDGSIKEINKQNNEIWHDMNIHKPFIKILSKMLGRYLFDKIQRNNPVSIINLLENIAKSAMNLDNALDSEMIGIEFPKEFDKAIRSEINDFDNRVFNFELNGYQKRFDYDDDTRILSMHLIIWKKYIYGPLITKVIEHVRKLLSGGILRNCGYIYLIGGYSMNSYFQNMLSNEFELNRKYKIKVIIPPNPILSVVYGAARMHMYTIKKAEVKHFDPKINIAIDFGTDGTGVAYSFPGGNDVFVYGKFKVQNDNNSNTETSKPRTAILLDKDYNFKAYGSNALRAYGSMNDTDILLFDHFKMCLSSMDIIYEFSIYWIDLWLYIEIYIDIYI